MRVKLRWTEVVRSAALAALLAAGLPGLGTAQYAEPTRERLAWELEGLRAGFCLHFLIDPDSVARRLDDHFPTADRSADLVPLSEAASVPRPLRDLAAESPEYSAWLPSAVCAYQLDATRRDGRVHREGNGASQGIGVWRLASKNGQPAPAHVMAGNFLLRRHAVQPAVQVDEFETAGRQVRETLQDELTIDFDGTLITWNGLASPDTALAVDPIRETWAVGGTRQTEWAVHAQLDPTEAAHMPGTVRVEGKGDLARLLHASPIRWIGPLYRGGNGRISFVR